MVLVFLCLDMKEPPTSWREKLAQMDYMCALSNQLVFVASAETVLHVSRNILFVTAATAAILGLTWGGTAYPWSSFRVLVPLILGFAGMIAFVFIEKTSLVKYPTVPFDVLRHPTSLLGYMVSFLHGIAVMAIIYFFPIYMQACYGVSAVRSGIDAFTLSLCVVQTAGVRFLRLA